MRRGKFTGTTQEMSKILGLFTENQVPLINKLRASIQVEVEPTEIEISEQELESILDALPAPGEDQVLDQLRLRLNQFLTDLRELDSGV